MFICCWFSICANLGNFFCFILSLLKFSLAVSKLFFWSNDYIISVIVFIISRSSIWYLNNILHNLGGLVLFSSFSYFNFYPLNFKYIFYTLYSKIRIWKFCESKSSQSFTIPHSFLCWLILYCVLISVKLYT